MRKFGVQTFLNPVDSDDSGWVKFSFRRHSYTRSPGLGYVSTSVQIADCSERIVLDYSVHGVSEAEIRLSQVDASLVELRGRRKKWLLFQKTVLKFGEKLLEAYDEAEEELLTRREEIVNRTEKIERLLKKNNKKSAKD